MIKSFLLNTWTDSAILNNILLKSLINAANKARVLDVGCGTGKLIIERVSAVKKPEIYAVEIDQKFFKEAKNRGIKVTKANIEKGFPYKDNFFDIVSANQIIEHVVNVDFFVEEIYRVLKPKGYLIISTENLSSWHNIFALLFGWQAFSQHISLKKNIGNPMKLNINHKSKYYDSHIKIFTPKGLKELFELNNFRIIKFFGAGYYPFRGNLSKVLSGLDSTHCAFIGLKAVKQ
ncbi:MAG: hypothetical protein UR98_C0006G0004 [Parcubacteria group bacterium GW2011_GWA1_36_12]|nr:MAG: hypothetical protein UR98_C0006G0004 [Parcubacteria group bacterium GW2011_GWA1_36_12]